MKEIIIKKPRQQRSWEKFHRILAACPRVLAEFGYEKSTTARMALEADVGIGTFYDYFSCKEAVFISYLDFELDRALESVAEKTIRSDMGPKSTLQALIKTGVDFAHDHREIIKIAFTHFPAEIHRINLGESRVRLEQIARDFTKHHVVNPRAKDISLMLYTLTNIVLGFQFRIVVMPDDSPDKEAVIEELTDIVYQYVFQ